MKPFKFSLESVLNLRSREEDAAKDSYAEAVAFYNRTLLALEAGLGDLEVLQDTLSSKRQGTSKKDDQLVYLQAIRQQRSFCDTLTQRLVRADQLQKVRFDLWMEARKKTQMLDKLKARHKERYTLEAARQEEKAVDDLVSARWVAARYDADASIAEELEAKFGGVGDFGASREIEFTF
jgi:flagellar export protein FliJ